MHQADGARQTADVRLIGITATRPVWALISGMFTIIMLGTGAWLTSLRDAQLAITGSVATLRDAHLHLEGRTQERLGRVETLLGGIQERQALRDQWQRRVEDKLDMLVSTLPPGRRPREGGGG